MRHPRITADQVQFNGAPPAQKRKNKFENPTFARPGRTSGTPSKV
jgi:hypothetical protein